MVINSIIKHLLCDDDSLSTYFIGKEVSFEDIKRRLFLLERNQNRKIPDHYYRLSQKKSFDGITSLSEVLFIGLSKIAEDYLELRQNKIYVKQEKQNDWQSLLPFLPPLILQASFLQKNNDLVDYSSHGIQDYFKNVILPNAKFTALPYPYIPQLENYITYKNGLHDLHMHLNGSTETDIAWQDFIENPEKIYTELTEGFRKNLVREQFEQESHLTDPKKFNSLLFIARRIRNYLFYMLFPNWSSFSATTIDEENYDSKQRKITTSQNPVVKSAEDLLTKLIDLDQTFFDSVENPFADLIANKKVADQYPMAIEGLMFVMIFNYLSRIPKDIVASLFHFYLLILGLANRLLVQQTHQYGFEQFQKHTINGLRGNVEKEYSKRFLQLHGNDLRNICFLEGRFSPKDKESDQLVLLKDILEGWRNLCETTQNLSQKNEVPKLKLIAHFIKVADKTPNKEIRHKELRKSVWQKACVLANMKEKQNIYINEVVGIDAASSEFDTPPEVFAPAFRLLRRRGFEHFTFHAGEDFYHIISGLRAIYESIDFFEMQHGDRIGHASAAGIDVKLWINNVGEKILIQQGEYLDNLLFSYHLIVKAQIENLTLKLPQLALEISEMCFKIYEEFYPIDLLLEAWQMRKYCPILLLSDKKEFAKSNSTYSEAEWCEITKQMPKPKEDKRYAIIQRYHHDHNRKLYEKIIDIPALKPFGTEEIKQLQLALLKFLHQKEIVIETLPTSNVRIGQHHDFSTYHLWNWIKWEKEGYSIPPIIVGTDDSGIFATNIYNEYANIYCYLTNQCEMNHEAAMQFVERLDKNASIYKFV